MATIKNIDRLLTKLNNIAEMDVKTTMVEATKLVHGQAKELAPVNTGNLAGSIRQEVRTRGKNIEGRVYTSLQYAPYVEFGTGTKGEGTYEYKKGLTYKQEPWVYTPDGGETFYTTRGQIAQPYMYPALKMHEKYIKKIFKDGVHKKLKENSKGG